jgi:hypothetical protein
MDTGNLGGFANKVYLFIGEFKICAVHAIDNNKLQVNFEVIVFQVGLDVFQIPKVVIVKKRMDPSLVRYLSTNPKMEIT